MFACEGLVEAGVSMHGGDGLYGIKVVGLSPDAGALQAMLIN